MVVFKEFLVNFLMGEKIMDFKDIIEKRRSIRKFSNKEVPDNLIKQIIYHGSIAPSGKNRQPWRFVVVKNKKIKAQISELMTIKVDDMIDKNEATGVKNTAKVINEAPVFIAVFNIKGKKNQNSNLQSIGASIENMCLSATDLGLGSLWICDIDCCFSEIQKLLGKPQMTLVAGIALGYALEAPKARPRLKVEEITDWV